MGIRRGPRGFRGQSWTPTMRRGSVSEPPQSWTPTRSSHGARSGRTEDAGHNRGHPQSRPAARQCRVAMPDHMHVIAHHRVGQHGDREQVGQLQQPRFQPGLAMVEAAPRQRVLPTQEGASHAPRHAVEGAGGAWSDEVTARIAHGASVRAAPPVSIGIRCGHVSESD